MTARTGRSGSRAAWNSRRRDDMGDLLERDPACGRHGRPHRGVPGRDRGSLVSAAPLIADLSTAGRDEGLRVAETRPILATGASRAQPRSGAHAAGMDGAKGDWLPRDERPPFPGGRGRVGSRGIADDGR